jgi:hypothetical protein
MMALNPYTSPLPAVWRYDEASRISAPITDINTYVYSIEVAGDVLCMLATGPGVSGAIGVSQYGLSGHTWIPLTGSNTVTGQILVQDGSEPYMLAANDNGPLNDGSYVRKGASESSTSSRRRPARSPVAMRTLTGFRASPHRSTIMSP